MHKKIKVLSVFGTRPEAIKMAPLVKELSKNEAIDSFVLVTAQHREMLDQVLETFKIKPDYDLDIMKKNQTIGDIISATLSGMEKVLQELKPDLVLVHGDTTTSFAAALAAFNSKVKIGHVEAGLRTFNKYSPYPEEMNRNLVTKLADIHFAPTVKNKQNLLNENVDNSSIHLTGNTVIDAILSVRKDNYVFENEVINNVLESGKKLILLTSHRRENQGEPMRHCFEAMREIIEENEDMHLVYPVHLNPTVRNLADEIFGNRERISLIEPLEYTEFANLMASSYLIFTDSGGIQEEAPSFDVPVLVLRTETERPEGLEAGVLILAGVEKQSILEHTKKLINDKEVYNKYKNAINPYGDGRASIKTVDAIIEYFNR